MNRKISIFCPMLPEAKLIAAYLPNVKKISNHEYSFKFGKIICANKIGKEAITHLIKNNYKHPDIPILFGMCGSLTTKCEIGDIFESSEVATSENKIILPLLHKFPNDKFLTIHEPCISGNERIILYNKYHINLVEMEGYYASKYFLNSNVKMYMIRIVSDTIQTKFTLPFSLRIKESARKVARAIIETFA